MSSQTAIMGQDPNNSGDFYTTDFVTYADWRVSGFYVYCATTLNDDQIDAGMLSSMKLRLQVGSEAVEQTVNFISSGYKYFDLSISVPSQSTLRISGTRTNCVCPYRSGSEALVVAGGYTAATNQNQMRFTIDYEPQWTIDSQNEGYPHYPGYDIEDFTEFEKDEAGYPRNWGVWKLDGNNDGYPWPVGFEKYKAAGSITVIKNGSAVAAGCVIFKGGQVIPANFKVIRG